MKQGALTVATVLVLVGASPASAADKAHQQLMAEIRMLQEQQQQLQQMMGALAETLKTVSTKVDDQTAANRKAFADQKLQIDNVADGVRVLREKVTTRTCGCQRYRRNSKRCGRRCLRCQLEPLS